MITDLCKLFSFHSVDGKVNVVDSTSFESNSFAAVVLQRRLRCGAEVVQFQCHYSNILPFAF